MGFSSALLLLFFLQVLVHSHGSGPHQWFNPEDIESSSSSSSSATPFFNPTFALVDGFYVHEEFLRPPTYPFDDIVFPSRRHSSVAVPSPSTEPSISSDTAHSTSTQTSISFGTAHMATTEALAMLTSTSANFRSTSLVPSASASITQEVPLSAVGTAFSPSEGSTSTETTTPTAFRSPFFPAGHLADFEAKVRAFVAGAAP